MVVINGKFMSQRITGVQRYAREILNELDDLLTAGSDFVVAVDKHASDIPSYKNIRVKQVGSLTGNAWEQISLPLYVLKHRAVCVNLCNMAPILTPHIVVIHDVSYKVNKNYFSRKFTMWYNLVFSLIIHRIKQIVTVSQFSRNEICRTYKTDFRNITIAYNGWQHLRRTPADSEALSKFGLEQTGFFFAMSSVTPNKNFRWLAENAKLYPDSLFAVGGSVNEKVFGDALDFTIPSNLKLLGYISDAEARTLMQNCTAFIFPTFYEGFGIPPLEALSEGAKAVVSDTSCMHEIFGEYVYYIDPYHPETDLNKLIMPQIKPPFQLLEKYDWKKSAEIILKVINRTQ